MNSLLEKVLKSSDCNVSIVNSEYEAIATKVAGGFGISYFLGDSNVEISKEEFYELIQSAVYKWILY